MSLNKVPQSHRLDTTSQQKYLGHYVGIIRDNRDPDFMGRLRVWIPEISPSSIEKEEGWITVSYASPFAGATSPYDLSSSPDRADWTNSQRSYGFWAVPPDLHNEVLVVFANGDISRGFWTACLYQQNMNHMVPGMAKSQDGSPGDYKGDKADAPVVEYNKIRKDQDPENPIRPVFDPLADALTTEGLISDPIKGAGNSSARRKENPNEKGKCGPASVFGMLTPNQNSFVMDDGVLPPDGQNGDPRKGGLIRLRTRSGAQIMINDDEGYLYMNSSNGKAWIKVSNDGGVEIYSNQNVAVRTSADYNIHSEGDLYIDAEKSIFIRAGADIIMGAQAGVDIGAVGDMTLGANGHVSSRSGGDTLIQASGALREQSGGDTSSLAGGNNNRVGAQIGDNSGGAPAAGANQPRQPQRKARGDVQNSAKTTRPTITSKMPTHEPFDDNPAGSNATNGKPGVAPTTIAPPNTSKNVKDRAASVSACVQQALTNLKAQHPDGTFVTYGYMMAMANQESSFKTTASASTSSAQGLYQFTKGTWSDVTKKVYGVSASSEQRNDPCTSAAAAAQYAYDNGKYLQSKGLTVGSNELYAAHFLGKAGASSFLQVYRDPVKRGDNAAALFPAPAHSNPGVFKPGSTINDVYNFFQTKVGSQTAQWETFGQQQASLTPPRSSG